MSYPVINNSLPRRPKRSKPIRCRT